MSNGSPEIRSPEALLGKFLRERHQSLQAWIQQICDHPNELESIEGEVHQTFAREAEDMIAGLLGLAMRQAKFLEGAEEIRRGYSTPPRSGVNRTRQVNLLSGLVIFITSLYGAPRQGRRNAEDSELEVDTELAQLGIDRGIIPRLENRIARGTALGPSLAMATEELERQGVKLGIKTVRRISTNVGQRLLAVRRDDVLQFREGNLRREANLRGKRMSVQIDGGRTRIRGPLTTACLEAAETDENDLLIENQPGRSKKKPKRTYSREWRKPKLVRIFVQYEPGKLDKQFPLMIDGTFEGPDALTEIVAMHLHRMGAAQALSVTFVADGAPWFWDRIDEITRLAGLKNVPVHQVLDNCHASQHFNLALKAMGLSETERMPLYLEHRTSAK